MKPIFWVFVFVLLTPFIVTAALFADVVPPLPKPEEWQLFLESIRGKVGIIKFTMIAGFVQCLLFIFRDRFMKLPGQWKLIVVQFLTVIVGVTGLQIEGFDWPSSFVHANTVGALQVFVHQVIKQWTDKGEPRYELPDK